MTDMTETTLSALSQSISAVVERAAGHVVSVMSHHSRSSGFVWRPGLIVTAEEALAEEGEVFLQPHGGERIRATRVGRDHSTDIALLRIDRSDWPVLPLAGFYPSAGSLSIAVGAAEGSATAALGVVSRAAGPWRSLRGGDIDARLELDVTLQRGAQGSVALDAQGNAFGMAVRGPRRTIVIPGKTIERVAALLEKHGRMPRGYFGLGLQAVRTSDNKPAAMVMSVDADGPGAKAGIVQGDVIIAINGSAVEGVRSLLRALGPDSIGSTVDLLVARGGATSTIAVSIGERPQAGEGPTG
jgi:S1-C subfamily serine protease